MFDLTKPEYRAMIERGINIVITIASLLILLFVVSSLDDLLIPYMWGGAAVFYSLSGIVGLILMMHLALRAMA